MNPYAILLKIYRESLSPSSPDLTEKQKIYETGYNVGIEMALRILDSAQAEKDIGPPDRYAFNPRDWPED